MILPENIDPLVFYRACIAKKIKIRSRYKNVFIAEHKGQNPRWMAEKHFNKKRIQEYFPFTIEGERQANKFILSLTGEINNT